jgi:hypothetical protein
VLARQEPGSVGIPVDRLQHELLPRRPPRRRPAASFVFTGARRPARAVRQAMVTIRNDLAKALRAAGLCYHEPTPRPTAARAKKAS